MLKNAPVSFPEVNFSEEGDIRHLHLGSEWIQGSMLVDAPDALVHEYIQRMMAWLLFVDPATVGERQAVQLGLGAGSLTKFCARELRMKNTTAIELNPQVLHACRGWFKLPADGPRMQVVLADAAQEILAPRWQASVDALQVDLYDEEAAAPVLDSAKFYADCRNTLTLDGCMTVNLFGRSSSFRKTVDKIQPRSAWTPSGLSRPPARAIRWCWRSERHRALAGLCCPSGPRPSRATGAYLPTSGSAYSNR